MLYSFTARTNNSKFSKQKTLRIGKPRLRNEFEFYPPPETLNPANTQQKRFPSAPKITKTHLTFSKKAEEETAASENSKIEDAPLFSTAPSKGVQSGPGPPNPTTSTQSPHHTHQKRRKEGRNKNRRRPPVRFSRDQAFFFSFFPSPLPSLGESVRPSEAPNPTPHSFPDLLHFFLLFLLLSVDRRLLLGGPLSASPSAKQQPVSSLPPGHSHAWRERWEPE